MHARPANAAAQRWARWMRRLRARLPLASDSPVQWVYSDRYRVELPAPALDAMRGQRILSFLDQQKILSRGDLHRTRRAPLRHLLGVHDEGYLRSLEGAEGLSRVMGFPVPANSVDPVLYAQRAMVGGTVVAARRALRHRKVVFNLGGGLHHASRERGQGFCLFNDVAVAIDRIRRLGFEGRVLVVDLDLHDGDGTRAIFAEDERVHTFSVHNRDLPVAAHAVESTSLALGTEVEDAAYLAAVRELLPPVVERFAPDLVFYLAGADPAFDDRLGDWRITPDGILERDRFVIETVRARDARLPVVCMLAGGYGHQAWRYGARLATWLATGRPIEPPDSSGLPLTTYRRLARHLSEPIFFAQETPEDDWGLSADDLPGAGPARDDRVLGRFSLHGIELALERVGLLDRVRTLGHRALSLEADSIDPRGQTLRLVSTSPARRVLFELRGRVDASLVPGLELLFVEWLLSQNPDADFPSHRPGLPGQRHPGTGLLRDVASLLLLAAERLGLDGVAYVPAHVSLALFSRRHVRFVDVVAGERFAAMLEAVGAYSPVEVLASLDAGEVVDATTGEPYRWEPTPVVVGIGERARGWAEAPERELARAEASRSIRYVRRTRWRQGTSDGIPDGVG